MPPADAQYDSQLGGAYEPPDGVTVLSRDREAPAALGAYSICYVNAFQTQPQDADWWLENHPELILRSGGQPVEDPNWPGEYLLDTTTPQNRAALLAIVGPWIKNCAEAGFKAIEADNLDTYARSDGAVDLEDNIAFARDFIALAHSLGLAAAQKNGVQLSGRGKDIGFDFAITESCQVYDECDDYAAIYGPLVFDIEYTDTPAEHFAAACETPNRNFSVILRDRNLTSPTDPAYVYRAC